MHNCFQTLSVIFLNSGDGFLYQVQFKRGIRSFLLSPNLHSTEVKTGSYVKVCAMSAPSLELLDQISCVVDGFTFFYQFDRLKQTEERTWVKWYLKSLDQYFHLWGKNNQRCTVKRRGL
mmetsp:Transcript_36030/g.45872  ORF Transcript_36030/g.45872 Transcript_36030/m.45872 type:complete len:119 (-) Transcript_36030:862-1218(-)